MDRINWLKNFLEEQPNDSFAQHALALEYIKAGDDATARSLFENLLSRDPGYVGSYYHLAKLLERRGDNEAAIEWYEKGIAQARAANDRHAQSELQSALSELNDL